LSFVDENARAGGGIKARSYLCEQVFVFAERVGVSANPDPATDPPVARPLIELSNNQIGLHAPLNVVVRGLKQHSRFTGVHRGVIEIKLGHEPLLAPSRDHLQVDHVVIFVQRVEMVANPRAKMRVSVFSGLQP
jgi:hypothetical protein